MSVKIKTLEQTKHFAYEFAKSLKGGEVILLGGGMGVGKTTFTKYLAEALGVKDEVTSPTFTILKNYKAKKFLISHFDMYRLGDYKEAIEFGIEEYLNHNKKRIVLIEWPEKVKQLLQSGDFITIKIDKPAEDVREFEVIK